MSAGRPILVTGSHRSGTTWTGKMIALSSQVVYFQEPFNADYYDAGRCGAVFGQQFRYMTRENEANFLPHFQRSAALQYNWVGGLGSGDWGRAWRDGRSFATHRLAGHRALFKDPFAVLSAEWMAERLNTAVIVLIRHPAAFVSSVKKFNWQSPIAALLQQPLLMHDFLEPCHAEMEQFAESERFIVEQAAAFWKYIYFVVSVYQERHPEWRFVRHEDLSRQPVVEFRRLFEFLELPFSSHIEEKVAFHSQAQNRQKSERPLQVLTLDSRENIHRWKETLTGAEIEKVREITQGVAGLFYGDEDW